MDSASLNRRLQREKEARKQAEQILKQKSEELFYRNKELSDLTHSLEQQVEERTKALEIARDEALAAARAKSEFVANMSHELRTPLNGILGTLRMLEGTQLSESQRRLVRIANESGTHLLEVVNDILDFSKIDAGKMKLEALPVDLEALLRSVLESMNPLAHANGIGIRLAPEPGFPRQVTGDPLRIKQIVWNLVSNAIKFTQQGSVEIGLSQHESRYCIRVKDTGIGMTPEQCRRIFDAFDQADSSITRQFGGTGLGLSICGRLVGMMQGEITVESVEGQGSTFSVLLPLTTSDSLRHCEGEAQKADALFDGQKILLVEDNAINQMIAVHLLEELGLRVVCADNGQQAIDQLEKRPFDCVLMDLQMPVMDGLEATRMVRNSNKTYSNIPIVAMTAHTSDEHRQECQSAGMNDHLSKPIDPTEVVRLLSQYLSDSSSPDSAPTSVSAVSSAPKVLNYGETMNRLGGDESIVSDLLQRFCERHESDGKQLIEQIQTQDWLNAGFTFHSLKGSAANVGAEQLFEWAGELEQATKEQDIVRIQQQLPEFDRLWKDFTAEVDRTLAVMRGRHSDNHPEVMTIEDVEARLEVIAESMDEDLSLVCEQLEQMGRCQLPERFESRVKAMQKAIKDFDIDELARLVDQR